jgi:hypothetical protein
VGAAVIATIVDYGRNSFERAGGAAIAAPGMDSRQQTLPATHPITPSQDRRDNSQMSDSEYGWGPFRLVDW